MDIEKYCQCFLKSITLRGLSFPKDYISSSPHPRNFTILQRADFANGQISKFFQISVFLIKKKPFGRRKMSLIAMFFDTFAIKRVYHIGKLPITYEEAWKLPLRFQ